MEPEDDKRGAGRRRALKSAVAVLPNGGTIDCVLKDVSESGARLQVANALSVPDRFELRLPGKEPTQVEVVWRKPGVIGIRFL